MGRTIKARPGELKAQYAKLDGEWDVCFATGDGCNRTDRHFLYSVFCSKRPQPLELKFGPSFLDELESRGYDVKTLKFSIQKKATTGDTNKLNP